MKKQLVLIGIVVLLVIVGLSGCSTQNNNENQKNNSNPESNRFIGSWKTNPVDNYWTFDFFSNGTFQRMNRIVGGNYEIKEGNLVLTYTDDIWIAGKYNYNFSDNDKTLTLNDTFSATSVILYKR